MPAGLAQQEYEKGIMEAACPRAVRASLTKTGEVWAPRLHPRYFLESRA
jgi:hypothetical protein